MPSVLPPTLATWLYPLGAPVGACRTSFGFDANLPPYHAVPPHIRFLFVWPAFGSLDFQLPRTPLPGAQEDNPPDGMVPYILYKPNSEHPQKLES
jgi:hypothetical protein